MEVTYEALRPIIVREELDRSTMHCVFSVEGQEFESNATVRKSSETGNRVRNIATRSVLRQVRSTFNRVLRRALGGGVVGSIGQQMSNTVISDKTREFSFSKADKEAAVVKAFQKISANFYYDEQSDRWKLSGELSQFETKLQSNPLEDSYDRRVMARMLVELASADGDVSEEERDFLDSFLTADTGFYDELVHEDELSPIEMDEVSSLAKETVFMVAAALAMSDQDFSEGEKDKLMEYADMLSLSADKVRELTRIGQIYILENAIAMSGMMTRDEIFELADQIELSHDDAERASIRFQKRQDR